MPAPPPNLIEGLATSAFQGAGLKGEYAGKLSKAVAQTAAQALDQFLTMAQVLPGAPAAVDPISGSGSTAGPGMLLPAPAGGPAAAQIKPLALSNLQANEIKGENAQNVAGVIAGAIAQGIQLFTTQVQMAPGVAIAGFVTTAPGRLM